MAPRYRSRKEQLELEIARMQRGLKDLIRLRSRFGQSADFDKVERDNIQRIRELEVELAESIGRRTTRTSNWSDSSRSRTRRSARCISSARRAKSSSTANWP